MSEIYESRTPFSDSSEAFSPSNKFINPNNSSKQATSYPAPPPINSSLHHEFFKAIQSRQNQVSPVTSWVQPESKYHDNNTELLVPINSTNLNVLLNNSVRSQLNIILIDVRSFGLYFQNRIKNAINLAVPSVLLKRTSYTLDKVCDSVTQNKGECLRNWSQATHILFYDHSSNLVNNSGNSATAILVGSKLRQAGYKGSLHYLEGGFHAFNSKFPEQCDSIKISTSDEQVMLRKGRKPSMTLTLSTPLLCQDSSSKTVVNPFFSNIRQNLELCHGPLKERFEIHLPPNILIDHLHSGNFTIKEARNRFSRTSVNNKNEHIHLPKWLNDVIEAEKGPRKLAEMYEQLERMEQQRLSLIMGFHSLNPNYNPSSMEFPFCITSNMEKGTMNRYNNIWPYEYSRIRLKNPNCDDYINANYVKYENFNNSELFNSQPTLSHEEENLIKKNLLSKESLYTMHRIRQNQILNRWYIATQAPLPETFNDFWKAIWDENSSIIVMLTREVEMNSIKCHRYWPVAPEETLTYGSITVKLLSEQNYPIFNINGKRERTSDPEDELITVRKFTLTCTNESTEQQRQITHFEYTGWTDFGVPDHPLGILQLIHEMNQEEKFYLKSQENKKRQGPITVHCSAGCGRTGTFCVIDTVIQRLSKNGQIQTSNSLDEIWKTVERFREQRISLVQTHRQFVFCYEAITWWLLGYGRFSDESHIT